MLQKFIQAVKGAFEETPEQKVCRELKENIFKNQDNIINNLKCPVCGGNSFRKGCIAVTGGHGEKE